MWLHRKTRAVRVVWAPSLLRRVLRHRGTRAALIVIIGLWCTVTLLERTEALDAERASWGSVQQVAVVTRPIAPGEQIADAVELRDIPVGLIPIDAVSAVDDHHRAKVHLFPEEMLLHARLTGTESNLVPPGAVALTIRVVAQIPLITVGDLVDLWMVDSANFTSDRVAHGVVVLAIGDDNLSVAVPDAQVATATIASLRPVTVTLTG